MKAPGDVEPGRRRIFALSGKEIILVGIFLAATAWALASASVGWNA